MEVLESLEKNQHGREARTLNKRSRESCPVPQARHAQEPGEHRCVGSNGLWLITSWSRDGWGWGWGGVSLGARMKTCPDNQKPAQATSYKRGAGAGGGDCGQS